MCGSSLRRKGLLSSNHVPRPAITWPFLSVSRCTHLSSSEHSSPKMVKSHSIVPRQSQKKREMDVEKALAAAGAERTRKQEVERLLSKVWRYSLFLNFGILIFSIAPGLAPASRPAFVPSVPAGYGFPVTCAAFTVATMAVQEMLARVLKRRPSPAAPRLAPRDAWQLAVLTWMFASVFFVSYLSFGRDDYFVRSCSEWELAGQASVLNLFIATHTVMDYLA